MIFIACPICKSHQFYVKDPSDPFEIYEFQIQKGAARFEDQERDAGEALVTGGQEIFCQSCSWHGKHDLIT